MDLSRSSHRRLASAWIWGMGDRLHHRLAVVVGTCHQCMSLLKGVQKATESQGKKNGERLLACRAGGRKVDADRSVGRKGVARWTGR